MIFRRSLKSAICRKLIGCPSPARVRAIRYDRTEPLARRLHSAVRQRRFCACRLEGARPRQGSGALEPLAAGRSVLDLPALRRASIVSSTLEGTVVSNELSAPPPLIADAPRTVRLKGSLDDDEREVAALLGRTHYYSRDRVFLGGWISLTLKLTHYRQTRSGSARSSSLPEERRKRPVVDSGRLADFGMAHVLAFAFKQPFRIFQG